MMGKTNGQQLAEWFGHWGHSKGMARQWALGLTAAVIASGIATYAVVAGGGPLRGPNPKTVFSMLSLDLVFMLLLAALIGHRLLRVWAERRAGAAGSRLHVRLALMFSVVAITPAILVAVFSTLVINFGVEQWFNKRVSTAVDESLAVATAYLEEHQQVIGGDALAMANDLAREGPGLLRNPYRLTQIVGAQAAVRGLSEAIVFDASKEVLARAGLAFSMELSMDSIPNWAIERARSGEVAVLTNSGDQRVRALVKLEGSLIDAYLYVGRAVDPKVIDHMDRTNRAVAEYKQLELTRSGLEVTFSAIFVMVALLLLLAAMWVGLTLANQMATPIVRLIDAAERIRGGDLSARVADEGATDELGSLSRAFNRMTSQLETQRHELMGVNRELDERRRFTEAVLEGVSAGVIGLDREGAVELPNRYAAEYLSTDSENMVGRRLTELLPEVEPLFAAVLRRPDRSVQDELKVFRKGQSRALLVRIVAEQDAAEVTGFVVTIDDITELLSAQRKAAWADVARRIAHEIKNPLTPIQLSAERLKRKYLKQIQTDPETFLNCTDTIIRQVGDIGRMVDEFSSFARMPAPVMKPDDLLEVVRQAVFLARTGYPNVGFDCQFPEVAVKIPCDVRQIGQAVTNLLKNAVEAIHGREGEDLPKGHISVEVGRRMGCVVLSVRDNGRGLPVELRDRLAEPYVTTRVKGTGLGLAIVKKIMEDHGGELVLEDAEGGGAQVSLVFRTEDDSPAIVATDTVTPHGA
ncbi:PAS domain-containing sensor histidine kinase [Telmatospirillum sp.]|uniref:sensor histidine kinase NtrY-like n=1 Tax=Telmatospirillum sp. TaxID=2079197 RepID=UPI002842B4B2|nr:PAS domain-containing sensor histidine kinase [Telmatospirillum sp.]MDR3439460.1 PAS domain-containing sensor histidine kinase [Telmatospirillum sp.]